MKRLFLAMAAVALVFTSCNTFNVTTFTVDKNVSLSQFKTFSFVKVDQDKLPKEINMAYIQMIEQDIASQMEMRGYKHVTDGNPDLAINLGMTVKNQQDVSAYTVPGSGYYWGPGFYWGTLGYTYGWGGSTTVTVNNYQVGTLLCDIIDYKSNKLLWYGSVDGVLNSMQGSDVAQNINKAIEHLFKGYPVPPIGKKK